MESEDENADGNDEADRNDEVDGNGPVSAYLPSDHSKGMSLWEAYHQLSSPTMCPRRCRRRAGICRMDFLIDVWVEVTGLLLNGLDPSSLLLIVPCML